MDDKKAQGGRNTVDCQTGLYMVNNGWYKIIPDIKPITMVMGYMCHSNVSSHFTAPELRHNHLVGHKIIFYYMSYFQISYVFYKIVIMQHKRFKTHWALLADEWLNNFVENLNDPISY